METRKLDTMHGLVKKLQLVVLLFLVGMVLLSLKLVFGQSLETYDNPLLGFKFQYPAEWKRVMTEGLSGVGFSLYELNNTEANVYDTFGFMTLDIPETKTLKQYLRDLNVILKINSSTLKLVETKLSGLSAMNATWIEKNDKVEMIYTILDKTAFSSLYKADSKTYDKNLKEISKIINSFQITE